MKPARPITLALAALLYSTHAMPCSFESSPTLVFDVRPDAPVERYIAGNLGILKPSYARSHLVIAWRHLTGRPPSAVERRGFADLLRHRLGDTDREKPVRAEERWEIARAEARGIEPRKYWQVNRHVGHYNYILNCNDHAFETAVATLRQRVRTFGIQHPGVQNWITAQETVFANCSDGTALPAPPEPSLPAVLRADREYQIAAADFYAMRYDEARRRFLSITADASSPWREIARLVAVRASLRKARLGDGELADVERELRAILTDDSLQAIHEPARDLLAFVIFRTNPRQRLVETANVLMTHAPRARRDLGDYTYLLDRDVAGTDELTDWIRTYQKADALPHALERWQTTRGLQWLVAALTHIPPDHPSAGALLRASENVGDDSPAYATISYHRARLLLARGQTAAARTTLDGVLALPSLPHSAINALRELRRPLARSFDDYLRDLPAVPVGYDGLFAPHESRAPMIPPDAAATINVHLPLDLLVAAARDERVPLSIRKQLIVAGYVRSRLLGRDDLAPELKQHFGLQSRDVFRLVLDYPFLQPHVRPLDSRIYENRDAPTEVIHDQYAATNWWCIDGRERYETVAAPLPPFLAVAEVRAIARKERRNLQSRGSGATWLLRNAIARAQKRAPDAAESLSRAIKGTRWTCGDEHTLRLAARAFALLHKRYAGTKWAKETKYWYGAPVV